MIPLTRLAHDIVSSVIRGGEAVIDATVGNGHDAVFLAQQVGPQGTVYGFEVQPLAIEKTRARLDELGLTNAVLMNRSHDRMADALGSEFQGRIKVVMFNLGYLPGGNKVVTTCATSTLAGIQQGLTLLAPGGVVSILAYPGHPEGALETAAVEEYLESLPTAEARVERHLSGIHSERAPRLFVVRKNEHAVSPDTV